MSVKRYVLRGLASVWELDGMMQTPTHMAKETYVLYTDYAALQSKLSKMQEVVDAARGYHKRNSLENDEALREALAELDKE